MPGGSTGPLLMRALRDAEVTTIVGVPRLYEALAAAIVARIDARGRTTRRLWQGLLRSAIVVQRLTRWPLGHFLFAPIRRAVAPRLQLLVSGGARLDRGIEEQLAALGWRVLSGYGLAETASLFTCNRPNERRVGSVGRPSPEKSGLPGPMTRGPGKSSCAAPRSPGAISTIPKPILPPLPRMDGFAPGTSALSIATGSCLLPGGSKRPWCWAAARK